MDEINEEVVLPENTSSGSANRLLEIIRLIWQWIYFLRKVLLSIPVLYGIIRLSAYNAKHLNPTVGLLLQADGEFLMNISRSTAVFAPVAITVGCLVMMFMSRKSLYAWSISVFSLLLPVIILFSNLFPA